MVFLQKMNNVNNKKTLIKNVSTITADIKDIVDGGGNFYLSITGGSMRPFLIQGTDVAVLSKPENIKACEVAFYKRKDNTVILHRVVAVHGKYYDMCGDNQFIIEKNVPMESVIAVMRGFYRNDKYVSCEKGTYKMKVLFWVKTRTFRYFVNRVKNKINRLVKLQ